MRKFLLYYYLETGRILYIRMDKIEVPGKRGEGRANCEICTDGALFRRFARTFPSMRSRGLGRRNQWFFSSLHRFSCAGRTLDFVGRPVGHPGGGIPFAGAFPSVLAAGGGVPSFPHCRPFFLLDAVLWAIGCARLISDWYGIPLFAVRSRFVPYYLLDGFHPPWQRDGGCGSLFEKEREIGVACFCRSLRFFRLFWTSERMREERPIR